MNVDIKILGYLGQSTWKDSISNFFHCEIVNRTPKLGGEELDKMKEDNFYEPRFVDISTLKDIDIKDGGFVAKALSKEYIKIKFKKQSCFFLLIIFYMKSNII